MRHPYEDRPSYTFWYEAISNSAPGAVDPVTRREPISPHEKVATLGSCFAQHISRFLANSGFAYFVPEEGPPGLTAAERLKANYGVFSARYGNVYTPRQALQLFTRAFGTFTPQDDVWEKSGCYVDAFRPRIAEAGFATEQEVRDAAAKHLGFVRQVFTDSQWIMFTLGLTESWESRLDGAVYPLAPGVAGGAFDPARHAFRNLTFQETTADLHAFIRAVREVNPAVKILLTVSPVALVATYEDRHVLSSTACSKAILRAAADEMERAYANVIYFPSYEIVTSPSTEGRYLADDLREVNSLGVGHVMRLFEKHFMLPPAAEQDGDAGTSLAPPHTTGPVVCDEEEIQSVMNRR